MPLIELSEIKDFSLKIDQKKIVLLNFYAPWCGPCKLLKPQLNLLSEDSSFSDVLFLKVNIDNFTELASQYKIFSLPTTIILKNKIEVERLSGFHPKNKFSALLQKNL